MSEKPENPSAFPAEGGFDLHATPGMTLHDYFAAAALTGMLANTAREFICANTNTSPKKAEEAFLMQAKMAFIFADAMLAMRKE